MRTGATQEVLVTGAGGFIGGHLAARLVRDGRDVRCVDIKPVEVWSQCHPEADNLVGDLARKSVVSRSLRGVSHVFHLAADMGGIGYITPNDVRCMNNIRLTVSLAEAAAREEIASFFFASSACVYPEFLQRTRGYRLREEEAYPAQPPEGYGWEKLYAERLLLAYHADGAFESRIARFHNIYGPLGTWTGGREKAPAAICRQVASAARMGTHTIPIWGTGKQTRSYCHIRDCVDGILCLASSDCHLPVNIGSDKDVSVSELVALVAAVAGRSVRAVENLDGTTGVLHRNADITRARKLGWSPRVALAEGLADLYADIERQVANASSMDLPSFLS